MKLNSNPVMRKLLVVDDNAINVLLLQNAFSIAGFGNVVFFTEAEAALEAIRRDKTIELVVSDIQMPTIGGLELLRVIKSEFPSIEVILRSKFEDFAYARSALRGGAFDYVLSDDGDSTELFHSIDRAFQRIDSGRTIAAVAGSIFISYAREDIELATQLANRLTRAGYTPWIDISSIHGGEDWHSAIQQGIARCSFFLACFSKKSVTKRGVIREEIRLAMGAQQRLLSSDIFMIPLRFEECTPPDEFTHLHWVDYFASDGWGRLLTAIQEGVRRRAGDA